MSQHKVTPLWIRIEIERTAANIDEARRYYALSDMEEHLYKLTHPKHSNVLKEIRGARELRQLNIQTYTNTEILPEAAATQDSGILLATMSQSEPSQQHDGGVLAQKSTGAIPRLLQPPTLHPPIQFGDVVFDEVQYVSDTSDWVDFTTGNPRVEVTTGVVHFYKANNKVSINGIATPVVCLLSVPVTLSCHDILNFVAPYHGDLFHIRFIRDEDPNSFMVLLEFRKVNIAKEFYSTYNGVTYSSLEEKLCHVVFVHKVEWGLDGSAPKNFTEVPTCSVCLERMDEGIEGLLTIQCDHSFHRSCLTKWTDSTCPVCRYEQTPELIDQSACMECECTDKLWICLICGHLGCGRYQGGHAAAHFRKTEHTYALQVGTNRVWDYAGDTYVHRLLLNQVDGTLVPHNPIDRAQLEESESVAAAVPKVLSTMQANFTRLLSTELDAQREYFEDKLEKLESRFDMELRDLKGHTEDLQIRNGTIENTLKKHQSEKNTIEQKLQSSDARLNLMFKTHGEERNIAKALQAHVDEWHIKYNSIEATFKKYQLNKEIEIRELNEQIHDLIYCMDAQSTLIRAELLTDATGATMLAAHAAKIKAKIKAKQEANNNNNNNNNKSSNTEAEAAAAAAVATDSDEM